MTAWIFTPLAFIIPYVLALALPGITGFVGSGWASAILIAIAAILFVLSSTKYKYFIAGCVSGSLFLKLAFDLLQSQNTGQTIWMAMFAAFFFLGTFFSIGRMATAD